VGDPRLEGPLISEYSGGRVAGRRSQIGRTSSRSSRASASSWITSRG